MKAIKNIMIALSGIALLASCDMDKFFELDRPESNPWLSVDDLEYSVADPYNTLFLINHFRIHLFKTVKILVFRILTGRHLSVLSLIIRNWWQICLRLIRKGLMSRKHFTGILVRCLPLM